ncbi:MAG: UDP-N-acetylglucosamine 2-epimerase (non-hydrolyzing) [Candidatus ainarchaeum sp.]|nr:UDP-N-acetylglucosamine 2-epimerase (non-hydrolyzing) [Candidatus ainarchaeum sp.]
MQICFILGTRPEIIKMAPLIRACEDKNIDYFVIHTNQHYSENMDKVFFKELNLKSAKYNLNVGSGTHGKQTGKMLEKIEEVLLKEKPDVVLVQGDTNTVLAGALAASKLHIKVGHVEAGLRSYDWGMPEEINRIMADHISDYLFCPTDLEAKICYKEGIEKNKVFVTGNSVVDAVLQNIKLVNEKKTLKKYGLTKGKYVYLTMHRPSNVDTKEALSKQIANLEQFCKDTGLNVLFPIHPRTKSNLEKYNLKPGKGIVFVDPVSYLDGLALMKNAKIILTDSGGIQEETCILGVPCLVLRENTERPQALDVGAAKLVGSDYTKFISGYNNYNKKIKPWKNPFGDGKTGEKIIKSLF